MRALLSVKSVVDYGACSHGSEGPQAGEVPRPGGVTNLSIQSLFFSWLRSHVRWDTPPRRVIRVRVTRFGGVSFLHVKAAEWGNPPNV